MYDTTVTTDENSQDKIEFTPGVDRVELVSYKYLLYINEHVLLHYLEIIISYLISFITNICKIIIIVYFIVEVYIIIVNLYIYLSNCYLSNCYKF